MKKIAVFTSATGEATQRLVSLFNEGNRLRVDLIVTDSEESGIGDRLDGKDVEILVCDVEKLNSVPSQILDILISHNVDLIAIDGFAHPLPSVINENYAGRIVSLSGVEEAPREVVAAATSLDGNLVKNVEEEQADTEVAVDENCDASETEKEISAEDCREKNVDEEWAETLHMNYDASRLRPTPPPVPGAGNAAPDSHMEITPGPQTGSKAGAFAGYATGFNGNRQDREPMPPAYLVWAIIIMVFCCTVPGIVAIIYSSQVSSKYNMGDIEGAKRASRYAQIWIIVAFVLGVLSSTLYLPIMLVS